jgi:phospholipid/cholesterol/gamma-HCH transport system substrate-binding protein
MTHSKRVYVNLVVFLIVSFLLIFLGARNLVFQHEAGRTLSARFTDASGLLPRNDVTMRGVVSGSVQEVELVPDGTVQVDMLLEPGVLVPQGTTAEIVRRSPIGELTLELHPGQGPAMADGAMIEVGDTVPPPDVSKTIEVFADVLHEVPSEELNTLVTEVADAVRGRSRDLARFSEVAADLPERILEVKTELDALIRTGPKVTGVFADNADVFADDITQTALLADLLRDRRFDIVELYKNGGDFLVVADDLLGSQKANLSCLFRDFGRFNETLARPQNLDNLEAVLETNDYFFGAVNQLVKVGLDGATWFRVQLLPHTEPPARSYKPHRPAPDVYPGNACRSPFGPGHGPVTQPNPVRLAPGSKVHPGR